MYLAQKGVIKEAQRGVFDSQYFYEWSIFMVENDPKLTLIWNFTFWHVDQAKFILFLLFFL